ncbi:MAG: hypothetical protein H7098_08165 [Oligoflexus sp.]|nr:hypothetical protein [Pseudopedobacter sp.]
MTFQEFFLKKKIDLEALQTNKPDLFSEFKEHYSLMGSKSFDHTKKYWFNNLRQTFPLSEEKENELKEAFKPQEIPKSDIITQPKETFNETKPTAGFKPRFKVSVIKTEEKTDDILSTETTSLPVIKPPGFKPRFKAAAIKLTNEAEISVVKETLTNEVIPENISKPSGFKPRFKK